MHRKIEYTYGRTVQGIMSAVNPIKKAVLKTNCTVHKYININAISILKNEKRMDQYNFFRKMIVPLNLGVTWADQDFKSVNHFYHYIKKKGLYGFSDAYSECKKYYDEALDYYRKGEINKALFFFGACCHLVQDVTVPQHVNNKLLHNHRKFEMWIISKLMSDYSFSTDYGIKRYDTLRHYFDINATMANDTYNEYDLIEDMDDRYEQIAKVIIKEAQRSTAGIMLDFYHEIQKYK